jgi:hypothetical protein
MSDAAFRRMSPNDRDKCTALSHRCKTGYVPTSDEMSYLERMFMTYPDDYSEISVETRRWANRMMNPMAGD